MATSSISGLSSGLDTASIIDQLMQLEAQTQTDLKTKLTKTQSSITDFQVLNSKLAALATQSSDISRPGALNTLKATSTSTAVTVSATSGTTSGSFDVRVDKVATTHRLTYATPVNGTDHATGATNDVQLTVGGVTKTLTTDGTLTGLVNALNATGTGVRASTLRLDDGTQRLIVQAGTSGAAGSFTLTGSDGADLLGGAAVLAGQDAEITIGTDTLHSATNTFSSVFSGVTLTVSAAAVGTTATVDVSSDSSAVKAKIKALVDAVNSTIGNIDTNSTMDPTTRKAGTFAGDATVSSLRTSLGSSIYPTDDTSMASLGLQVDRTGKLVFDDAAFDKAYAADPNAVMKAYTDPLSGFAHRVNVVAKTASDSSTGTITAAITGRNATVATLQKGIQDWDDRLTLRRATLTRQYTALETALNKMQSQSSWLAGQISSLPSTSS